jgi:hypothetical protein
MVGHQAVGPDLDAALAGLFSQQVAIDLLIPILEEDRLAPVAALFPSSATAVPIC